MIRPIPPGFGPRVLGAIGLWVLYGALALLACGFVLQLPGYPYNQNEFAVFEQVEVFRQAIATGQLFPGWNPFAQQGYGAVWPFRYPRLYGNTIGLLAALLGSTLSAIKLSIPLSLTVGAIGMHQTARLLQLKLSFRIAAAGLLVFANSTYNLWLLQGNLSEFWAAMLIPWLLYGGSVSLQGSSTQRLRASLGLGLLFVLLFWSNAVIFYYALLPLLIVFAAGLISKKGLRQGASWHETLRLSVAQLLPGLSLFSSIMGGAWLGNWRLGNTTELPSMGLDYNNFYRPPLSYLADTVFRWQEVWGSTSVELSRGITITFLLILLVTGLTLNQRHHNPQERFKSLNLRFLSLCIVLTFIYIQYDWLRPLYPDQPWLLLAYFSCTLAMLVFVWQQRTPNPEVQLHAAHSSGRSLLSEPSPTLANRNLIVIVLGIMVMTFVYLQLPISLWFYLWLPQADMVQFPWRLMSFITPPLSLLLCERLDTLSSWEPKMVLANVYRGIIILVLVNQVGFGLRVQDIQYPTYAVEQLQAALEPQQLARSPQFQFEDPQLPQSPAPAPALLTLTQCQLIRTDPPLTLTQPQYLAKLTLTLDAPAPCTVELHQYPNPFLKIIAPTDATLNFTPAQTPQIQLPSGRHTLQFQTKSIWSALGSPSRLPTTSSQ
ncbi:MAG: hypothetical protein AAGG51_10770 [Cyanobacteria bacterium P01_G01_bin.54]